MSSLRADRTKEWTPGWYPGYLTKQLHASDRGKYNNTFNVTSTSSPYMRGVAHVGATQLWLVFLALAALLAAEVRKYFVIPSGTLCRSLRLCICILASGLLVAVCLELFLHISVIRTMPAITMHPADNGEIVLYMRRVEEQMVKITTKIMDRYYGTAVRMSYEPVYVHRVLENILRATDELLAAHRSPGEARVIQTPLKLLMVSSEWMHFLMFMIMWSVSLLIVASLSITRCYLASCAWGIVACGLGASLLLMAGTVVADACFDPRYTLYTMKTQEFYRTEEEALRSEYGRVCREWFSKFQLLLEHYEKNFMYAAYELHTRSMVSKEEDDWRYLDETAEKIYNVSRDDVSELSNITPPRCGYAFPEITSPARPLVTARTASTPAQTLAPGDELPVQPPHFLPPYDVVMRALCTGDRKLTLLMIQMFTLLGALGGVILILLFAFLGMRPRRDPAKYACARSHVPCLSDLFRKPPNPCGHPPDPKPEPKPKKPPPPPPPPDYCCLKTAQPRSCCEVNTCGNAVTFKPSPLFGETPKSKLSKPTAISNSSLAKFTRIWEFCGPPSTSSQSVVPVSGKESSRRSMVPLYARTKGVECLLSHHSVSFSQVKSVGSLEMSQSGMVEEKTGSRVAAAEILNEPEVSPRTPAREVREIYLKFHQKTPQ